MLWPDTATSPRGLQEKFGAIGFGILSGSRIHSREGDSVRRHPDPGEDTHSEYRAALRREPPYTPFRDEIGDPEEE
jgi:hypothetical protein